MNTQSSSSSTSSSTSSFLSLSSSSSPPLLLSSTERGRPIRTPPSASSRARGKRIQSPVDNIDVISQLPDHLLQKILSRLPLRYAVKTSVLSKRWGNVWKERLHLYVDMRLIMLTTSPKLVHSVSRRFAQSMTQTINNHRGRLESCTIRHFLHQCEDGTLESWIQTVTSVKHTKELTLMNYLGCMGPQNGHSPLHLAPSIFSHHGLTSLSLTKYKLAEPNAFNNCCNLKTLKLIDIIVNASVLSRVFTGCSFLEVLVLHITTLTPRGCVLKIEHDNLEVLQVVCHTLISNMEVKAPRLEILDLRYIYCARDKFSLDAPKIRFNRNDLAGGTLPRVSCNISSLPQAKIITWLELMVSDFYHMRRTGSLSVSVDVKNPKELETLTGVLFLWCPDEMKELEIILKNNDAPREEGESSTNAGAPSVSDGVNLYLDNVFRVYTVWMYNFNGSNEEEFAFVSRFVTEGIVLDKLMIQTSAYTPTKKLMVEAKVAKLMDLAQGNDDEITIECF